MTAAFIVLNSGCTADILRSRPLVFKRFLFSVLVETVICSRVLMNLEVPIPEEQDIL
jgi:hypothetical protein